MNLQSNHKSVARFWNRYRKALSAHKIRGKAAEWYIKRVEYFIKSARGLKLREHAAEDVKAYFCRQILERRLTDWQLSQTVDALKILFTETVNVPWSSSFPWEKWKEPHLNFPDELERFDQTGRHVPVSGKERGFADTLRGRLAVDKYGKELKLLSQAIRVRHYSIRTEQTYTDWLMRFIPDYATGKFAEDARRQGRRHT